MDSHKTDQDSITYSYVDPWSLTWHDALNIGECAMLAFAKSPFDSWWHGPRYDFRDDRFSKWQKGIVDPRKRLSQYMDNARCYSRMCRTWGRDVIDGIVESGTFCMVARNSSDVVVGFCLWRSPADQRYKTDVKYGKVGWKWWAYSRYLKIRNWVGDFVDHFGQSEHPTKNKRREWFEHQLDNETVYERPELDWFEAGELLDKPLKSDLCWKLRLICVHPGFQGHGIGSALLRKPMQSFPTPCKAALTAVETAKPVYEKLGYRAHAVYKPEGYPEELFGFTRYRMQVALK